jgi:hypothetical protein
MSRAWSGTIGYTFDEFPHLGRAPNGAYYAMGYCGTGVSRATHFGRKVALQMLGRPEGRSAFDDLAFPSHLLHALARPAVPLLPHSRRNGVLIARTSLIRHSARRCYRHCFSSTVQ